MLFNFFDQYKLIPQQGNPLSIEKVISKHSEIPRKEYDYIFNSDGVRSIEFSEKPNILAMGCSLTFGLGLPVELTWPSLLEKKIGYKIGNLSYNGASPVKNISAFFSLIKKYNYIPEYVICNFANMERSIFFTNNTVSDIFWVDYLFKFKDSYPYDYERIIPVEWIYFLNLEYIKMLEIFCKHNSIKLIWSTWSNNIKEDYEQYIKNNFNYYFSDTTRELFPRSFEYGYNAKNHQEILEHNKMINWDSIKCHSEYYEKYPDIFHYAYDYHQIKVDYIDGVPPTKPHPGIHNQLHWAEFYYNIIKNDLK